MELDLPTEEVHELYKDDLKLNGLHMLVQVYEVMKDYNLYTLLDRYKIMKQNPMSHFEILEGVRYGNRLQYFT